MATNFGTRRSVPPLKLKTYSKRVKNGISKPAERKLHIETDHSREGLLRDTLGRVLYEGTNDHIPITSPEPASKKRLKDKDSAPTHEERQFQDIPSPNSTSSVPRRHPFNEIDTNHINNSAEESLSNTGVHKDLTSNISPDTKGHQDELLPILSQSTGEAKDLTQQASEQGNQSHSEVRSKKRRKEEASEAHSAPESKRAKHASITSYFKPLPSSSSPSTLRSTSVFSDNPEPPSIVCSPPSSPISVGESTQYRKRTQKRRLTTKPSGLPLVTMPYEKYQREDDWVYEEIIEPIDFMISRQEQLDEENTAFYRTTHQALLPIPRIRRRTNPFYVRRNASNSIITNCGANNATASTVPTEDAQGIVTDTKALPATVQKHKARQVHYIQSQLTSERDVIEYCNDCNLMYNRTNQRDVRDHNKIHTAIARGSSIHRPSADCIVLENHLEGVAHRVYVSKHNSNLNTRLWFEHALYVSEMGGLEGLVPTSSELWSEIPNPPESGNAKVPRYKTYVYTIDMQVIAVILAERINLGGAFYSGPKTHDESGPLLLIDEDRLQEYVSRDSLYDVYVSIDRIWTRRDHRRMKYATILLDHVRKDFIAGTTLDKNEVAFSYPTTNGRNFAKKYFKDVFPDCDFAINLNDAPIVVEGGKLKSGYRHSL